MSGQDIFKVHGQVSAQAQRLGYVTKKRKNVPQWLRIRQLCSKLEEGGYHCFTLPPPTASGRTHEKQYTMLWTTLKKIPQYNLIWYFPGNDTTTCAYCFSFFVNECVILDRNQSSMLKWWFEVETERKNYRYVLLNNMFQDRNTTGLADSPFGRPSCCSSLDRDSLSTLCFAALEKMKLSIATLALMSPISAT